MSGASEVDVDGGTVAAAVALPPEGVDAADAAAESAVPNDVDPLLTSPPTSPPNPPPDDDPNCAEPLRSRLAAELDEDMEATLSKAPPTVEEKEPKEARFGDLAEEEEEDDDSPPPGVEE